MTATKFSPIAIAIGGVVTAVIIAFGGEAEYAAGAGVAVAGALASIYGSIRNRPRPQ